MFRNTNLHLITVGVILAITNTTLGGDDINSELIGTWDGFGGTYGDVWGDGSFAYLGHFGSSSVSIVDISNPAMPVGAVYQLPPPNQGASAQDLKVADGILFIGLGGSSSNSVHIVDVRDPLNPQAVVDIDISGFTAVHNVFYDNGYLYMVDSGSTRVGIIDLTQLDLDNPPENPITNAKWIMQDIGSSFVHDITVVDGRMYACAWDSGLWIYDVTNVANVMPNFIGSTPDGGNNTHATWPTANGDYVVTGEERPGGGIKVYRITDNGGSLDLELTDSLQLPENEAFSVHNQVIDGYRLYNSWYAAGLLVHDIDPKTGLITLFATYQTPGSNWGVYPLLGQDNVLLSDMGNGLAIVRIAADVAGDLDGDGSVNTVDLLILFANWGHCSNCKDCPADLNGDCIVSTEDLLLLFSNWG
ncbi:MAG: hypothetical protein IH984_11110 [Planctomycetes bacterium]|nr:hypothetical protein [Planctomycetota bacterium]